MRFAAPRDAARLLSGGMMSDAEATAEARKHSQDEGTVFSEPTAMDALRNLYCRTADAPIPSPLQMQESLHTASHLPA